MSTIEYDEFILMELQLRVQLRIYTGFPFHLYKENHHYFKEYFNINAPCINPKQLSEINIKVYTLE